VLEAAGHDYVRTARAKGVSELRLLRHHILPNAWVSIVTVIGLQLGFLLGGVVVVEVIFNWPGIGRLALIAVNNRDFTLLQGTVLYIALMFLLVNLVVDVLYAALDPRIKYR
jgi:ABC-type dipeptide/oligopeptide/nickel transport system permease component